MKKDNLDNFFNSVKGTWDTEEPQDGHELRFLEKLNALNGNKTIVAKKNNSRIFYAIAASVLVLFGIGFVLFNNAQNVNDQVVKISPEISKTEFYFTNIIEQEISKLKSEDSPKTKKIIDDTLLQLTKLEKDYETLETDLINGGNSKFILSAMIINFQTRIDLLQEVLQQVDEIKKIDHENTII